MVEAIKFMINSNLIVLRQQNILCFLLLFFPLKFHYHEKIKVDRRLHMKVTDRALFNLLCKLQEIEFDLT